MRPAVKGEHAADLRRAGDVDPFVFAGSANVKHYRPSDVFPQIDGVRFGLDREFITDPEGLAEEVIALRRALRLGITLIAASLDDVRGFYREHYTPDNLCLLLAGDFEPAQAREWIAKYFGSWTPGGVRPGPPHSAHIFEVARHEMGAIARPPLHSGSEIGSAIGCIRLPKPSWWKRRKPSPNRYPRKQAAGGRWLHRILRRDCTG